MIQIYNTNVREQWDEVVQSFPNYDVYYMSGYVEAFRIHGDGVPHLLYYRSGTLRAIYVFMRRETELPGLYDAITPYGYGGVLFDREPTQEEVKEFYAEYAEAMRGLGVVCNFVRYHPVLRNADLMRSVSTVVDLGPTIAMELDDQDLIWKNITGKNRNTIRKAERNGVTIHHGTAPELIDDFIRIYNATMDSDKAEEYYYFGKPFYESIRKDLAGNYEIFYALCDERIVAMSIMIFANGRLNYHLSGSVYEYRRVAPSNLLLYEAAKWGCERGMKTFHLGGGVGSSEDSLYSFKAGFNRNSDYRFSIGKELFDQAEYDRLVELCRRTKSDFDPESSFFPLYRQ